MSLERTPIAPPFDAVKTETGHIHLQCTVCADHIRWFDDLHRSYLLSCPLGRVRLALLVPWMLTRSIKFMCRHTHCISISGGTG